MENVQMDYEQRKRGVRFRAETEREMDEFDPDLLEKFDREVKLSDVAQVGSKILIGGGLGLLAGVATIAIVASAAEVVVAGVITKIAGVVGGAVGLSMGVKKFRKKKKRAY